MTFDIRTLLFETPFICALFSVCVFAFALKVRRFPGLWTMGSAFACLGVGALLLMLRGSIDHFFSIVVGNLFVLLFYILTPIGLFQFIGVDRKIFVRISFLLLLFTFFSFSYFTFYEFDVSFRIFIIEALVAVIFLFSACWLFFNRNASHSPLTLTALSALFLARALYALFRIAWTNGEPQIVALMDAGVVHGLSVIFAQIVVAIVSLAVLYLCAGALQADLRRAARVDPLTQTLNRAALTEVVEREEARHKRGGPSFAVLMSDIDHFKKLNDTHGHAVGDQALIAFAATLRSALRKQDTLARYGGEEFVVLLPDTDLAAAAAVAEKLRSAVQNASIDREGETSVSMTASFGVAPARPDQSWAETLRAADGALYDAKRDGRNRVAVAA